MTEPTVYVVRHGNENIYAGYNGEMAQIAARNIREQMNNNMTPAKPINLEIWFHGEMIAKFHENEMKSYPEN